MEEQGENKRRKEKRKKWGEQSEEGATIRDAGKRSEARPRGTSLEGRKNLTGSPLVSLGSPNNGVRPLNKQQFGITARHPRYNRQYAARGETVNAIPRAECCNSLKKRETAVNCNVPKQFPFPYVGFTI